MTLFEVYGLMFVVAAALINHKPLPIAIGTTNYPDTEDNYLAELFRNRFVSHFRTGISYHFRQAQATAILVIRTSSATDITTIYLWGDGLINKSLLFAIHAVNMYMNG